MSGSSSDEVNKTVCVCLWGVILFSLQHSKHLKQDVLRELQLCLRGVCWKFQGCLKDVSRMFLGIFKTISKKFQ